VSFTEGAAANNPQFEPQALAIPITTPLSTISNPQSASFAIDTSKVLDQAMSHFSQMAAQSTGLAAGAGMAHAGLGAEYGLSMGQSSEFIGYFYDLKQTSDRKPTDIAEDESEASLAENRIEPNSINSSPSQNHLKLLRSFVKDWDMSLLEGYYKAPKPLYTGQIAIPVSSSQDATAAFNVSTTVRARRWIIIYQAKITPPASGRYRFIGFADDFMVVRINGENVLDASLAETGEGLDPSANVSEDVGIGPEKYPLKCGAWVDMEAGITMDMQVLIGEGPGGQSGFLLMVQKQGDDSSKGDYPVFQLNNSDVPVMNAGFVFSKKKMLFQPDQ
jgi:hypothetical protein